MSPQTILVVDDEFSIRRLLARVLRKREVQVITADSVDTAEMLLLYNQVDLILCDHQMTGEKGISFLSRLRTQFPDMVRALMTGDVDFALTVEAINDGQVDYCIAKPFELAELQSLVGDLLSWGRRREAAIREAAIREADMPEADMHDSGESKGNDAGVVYFGKHYSQMIGA